MTTRAERAAARRLQTWTLAHEGRMDEAIAEFVQHLDELPFGSVGARQMFCPGGRMLKRWNGGLVKHLIVRPLLYGWAPMFPELGAPAALGVFAASRAV